MNSRGTECLSKPFVKFGADSSVSIFVNGSALHNISQHGGWVYQVNGMV